LLKRRCLAAGAANDAIYVFHIRLGAKCEITTSPMGYGGTCGARGKNPRKKLDEVQFLSDSKQKPSFMLS